MNAEKLIAAIRLINQHHNLGDAIYAVRERAVSNDPGYKGESWEHPIVKAYSDAVQVVGEEIGGWGDLKPHIPAPLPCPFCGEDPIIEIDEAMPEVSIICTNTNCPANPEISRPNHETAVDRWNARLSVKMIVDDRAPLDMLAAFLDGAP